MRIGIDIGNVLIGGDGEDTFFTEDYLSTPEVDGAWSSLCDLQSSGHEVHLVSKCGPTTELKTLKWLDVVGYFYTVREHRIHFVRKRHLKAPMAQALELDIFIDDRQDIIDSMDGIVKYPILFQSWEQVHEELVKIFASEG